MNVLIKAKKSAADPRIKSYAQAKVERLTRHFEHILEARMELSTEKNKSLETMKVAQLMVHVNGTVLKAVQGAGHMNEAIDLVVDKMDRQIRQHKERQQDRWHKKVAAGKLVVLPRTQPEAGRLNGIAKVKRYRLKPISEEQAAAEMAALEHPFFLFINENSQEVNVLYRRRDGTLGLLEADLG